MAEKQHRYKGIAGTILAHLILLSLLVFLGFSTPLPLPEEEGVEVSLGADMQGRGTVQPQRVSTRAAEPAPPVQESKTEEELYTQVTEAAPVIEQKVKERPKEVTDPPKPVEKKPEETQPVEEKPVVNPNALYKGKSKDAAEQVSQGETGDIGDQGAPHGTVDASKYIGQGGSGEGMSYNLSGRLPKYLPKPSSNFRENGTVVVQIWVDKYGKITRAIAIDKGSNTTSGNLRRLAVEAAGKAIFNANPNAPDEQKGTITYHFIVKQ